LFQVLDALVVSWRSGLGHNALRPHCPGALQTPSHPDGGGV